MIITVPDPSRASGVYTSHILALATCEDENVYLEKLTFPYEKLTSPMLLAPVQSFSPH